MLNLAASLADIPVAEIILKGLAIGLIAAAPTGPSGVLVIERTLSKGRWPGFFTGLGVTISDTIYILLSALGLSFILDFIEDPTTAMTVKFIGCGLLLVFGIHTIRDNPLKKKRGDANAQGPLLFNTLSGFLVAIVNPLVVFIYLTLFTYFSYAPSELSGSMKLLAFGSLAAGDVCWWLFLSFLINKVRNRFDLRGIWVINRILGSVLIVASVAWFILILVKK